MYELTLNDVLHHRAAPTRTHALARGSLAGCREYRGARWLSGRCATNTTSTQTGMRLGVKALIQIKMGMKVKMGGKSGLFS